MRRWHLSWPPGSQMEYHALSAHWVLAELIESVTGTDYRQYIQSRIIEPLGLKGLRLGVPDDEQGDIATLQHVGEPPTSQELRDLLGSDIEWPNTVDDSLLMFNDPKVRALGVPGGGAVASVAADFFFPFFTGEGPGISTAACALSTGRSDGSTWR